MEVDFDGVMLMDWSNKSEAGVPVEVGFAVLPPEANGGGVTVTFVR